MGRATCFPAARGTRKPELWVWRKDRRSAVNHTPSCPHSGSHLTPEPSCRALTSSLCPSPQEIRAYHQRSLMEKELLFFSYDVFGIPFVDPVSCAGAGWMWWPDGKGRRALHPSQILAQLLTPFFWLQDTWTPEEVVPKRLQEKQK